MSIWKGGREGVVDTEMLKVFQGFRIYICRRKGADHCDDDNQ